MSNVQLKTIGLLIVMITLHGCKERHEKNPIPHLVRGGDSACFADLPHQLPPVEAAAAAYEHGDRRLLIFEEYGEGNYPVAPVLEAYSVNTGRPWQPGSARMVSMSRDNSKPLQCVDCDSPPDACGVKKQEWLRLFNSEICRRASVRGLRHCGVKYVQL
ncbi:hypothetical protein [Sphingomonas sp. GC_Shp_2]|uniref:hypothetical protein n=1 Tax=Sphingomonas sp. GC_Shp_2 TaxID=2937384 RepID=UPI00226A3BD0|nr:hypothetical protein [Sphingomonas sp. GC_Shp_2]